MTNYTFPEQGRLAAHVLIDSAIAYEPGAGESSAAAVNLAFQRLADVDGAIVAHVDDATFDVTLELTHVLGAVLLTVGRLMEELATARGVDREHVAAQLRDYVDTAD